MLGRPFKVQGSKVPGKGLGRTIGYPTINLELSTLNLELPFGVYEVEVEGQKAIANYGLAPTMGDMAWHRPVLEIHFFGASSDSLNSFNSCSELPVSFLRFIRPEKKFETIDDLKRQIAADYATITA